MRTKKAISLLFIFLYSLNALAYDFMAKTPSGHLLCYDTTKNGTVKVVAKESRQPSYKKLSGELIIPDKVIYNQREYTVVSIGKRAFLGCDKLLSITTPNTIKYIEDYAFWNCSRLNTISLPDSLCHIGKYSFFSCSSLKKLVIPKHVLFIGEKAFSGVPDVEYNGNYSTNKPWGCKRLNGVGFGISNDSQQQEANNNHSIINHDDNRTYDFSAKTPSGHLLCYDTTKNGTAKVVAKESQEPSYKDLTGDLVIPEKITYNQHEYKVVSIGVRAFFGCNELLSVTLPITTKYIEDNAFYNCTKLNAISLPEPLCYIGNWAFSGCKSLKKLVIPNHVLSIGHNAFSLVPDIEYNGNYSTNKPWGCINLNGVKTEIQDSQRRNTPRDENWYRNYFKEHIKELDPIEGIYSVSSLTSAISNYDRPASDEDLYTVVIIKSKKGDFFETHSLSIDNNKKWTQIIYPIGETEIYNSVVTWDICDEKAIDRIILDNLYGFKTSYKIPNCVMQHLADETGHWPARYTTVTVQKTYIKSYPTKSMYETAITNTPKTQPSAWSGTGYAIGSKYIVTNNHVIDGAKTISIKGIKGDFNTGYTAEIVATDKVNDIAVLKISDNQFSGLGVIPYSVSTRMADVGEDAFVLGYPLTQALGNEIKLTNGIISSRTGYQGDIATYQISAPVQPGNSGGPMFDSKGNVIGIVVAGVPGAENVGYAIKTSYLKILIESAGLNIHFPANNTISALSLPEKVKRIKNFVYYIECSK